MSLGSHPSAPAPTPPPPPPPNPGTAASAFGSAISSVRRTAAAGEGKGFDNTITNTGGAQGIANDLVTGNGEDAQKILTGRSGLTGAQRVANDLVTGNGADAKKALTGQ